MLDLSKMPDPSSLIDCTKCKKEKTASEFHIRNHKKGKLNSWCKECMREILREKAKERREKAKDSNVEPPKKKFCSWCVATLGSSKFRRLNSSVDGLGPYCRRCESSRASEWRERNPLKVIEIGRKRVRKKYAENREYNLARAIKQDRMRRGAEGSHAPSQIEKMKADQGWLCATCHRKPKIWHRDHIVPISKGGTNYIENIQMLCADCNWSKSAMSNEDFLKKLKLMGGTPK